MNKVIYDFGNGIRYLEADEPFNTKYPTWIVAYCPDEDSFFVTNERHFFWESEEEFDSEEEAIDYVENHVGYFVELSKEIQGRMRSDRTIMNRIWLENTRKFYF